MTVDLTTDSMVDDFDYWRHGWWLWRWQWTWLLTSWSMTLTTDVMINVSIMTTVFTEWHSCFAMYSFAACMTLN